MHTGQPQPAGNQHLNWRAGVGVFPMNDTTREQRLWVVGPGVCDDSNQTNGISAINAVMAASSESKRQISRECEQYLLVWSPWMIESVPSIDDSIRLDCKARGTSCLQFQNGPPESFDIQLPGCAHSHNSIS